MNILMTRRASADMGAARFVRAQHAGAQLGAGFVAGHGGHVQSDIPRAVKPRTTVVGSLRRRRPI